VKRVEVLKNRISAILYANALGGRVNLRNRPTVLLGVAVGLVDSFGMVFYYY